MRRGKENEEKQKRMREEAEKAVAETAPKGNEAELEIDRVNHELRVHQIELEMQNEELRRSQNDLEASRDRYHDLYEFAPVGYFTLDEKLKIRDVNLTGAALLERSRRELEGKAFKDYINTNDLYLWIHHIDAVRRGNGGGDCEIALDLPNGGVLHSLIQSVMMRSEGGELMMRTVVSDVGVRWLAEKEAKVKGHKLEMLAAITRHDLLNQISILRGYQELAERTEDLNEARDRRMKAANAAKNLEAIVNFTIQYQQLGGQSPEWIDIRSQVDKACRGPALNRLELRNELDTTYVLADPMIGKVFYNLVENAIRHAKGATFIRFRAYVEMGKLLIICEDDGIGIRNEDKERIFERGFGGNTGLGLFFAREILAITKISIVERGGADGGAKFVIYVLERNWRETPLPNRPNCPPPDERQLSAGE